MKEKNTLRYSLNNRPKDSQTDWKRVKNMTEAEIEAAAASDVDAQPTDETFWANAEVVMPQPKYAISLRVDSDVLDWFKSHGSGLSDTHERGFTGIYGSPAALGLLSLMLRIGVSDW